MKYHIPISLIILSLNVQSFSQLLDYSSSLEQVLIFEKEGRTGDAVVILNDLMDKHPDKWFYTSKKLIELNERAGLYKDNINIFKEAHYRGLYYFIHPQMPVYEPYKDIQGFDKISARDLELRDSANKVSTTIYEVVIPPLYYADRSWPVLFIFHGGGSSIKNVMNHWQSPALEKNYIKVYLQSYRHFDSESYGWGTSDPRLDAQILDIYSEIEKKYNINPDKVVTGGISAGATAAIDLCLRNIIPARGIIAWCPDIPLFFRNRDYSVLKNKNIKVYISAGENDHFRPRQESMVNALDSLGIQCNYIIEQNRGHEYPSDECSSIKNGLRYLFTGK